MEKPNFHIETLTESKQSGVYALYPLPRGFGYTIGNALRRVLLSSLEGAAVTYVKIKNITHPFTTIKGLKEDVLSFLLNIKQLRFSFKAKDEQRLLLKKKGPGKITAKDIEDNPLCKIVNPDLYLGELASGGSIEAEIFVNKGVGYEPTEEKEDRGYGVLSVDSVFSPVENVAIQVEGTRVGRKTNYDKLTITIDTDGSITGTTALKQAGQILVEYFDLLVKGGRELPTEKEPTQEAKTTNMAKDTKEGMMVDELDLPTRVINALIKHGIETVKELGKMSDAELSQVRGLGKKSIEQLKEKVRELVEEQK